MSVPFPRAVIKIPDKQNLGEKGFIGLTIPDSIIVWGNSRQLRCEAARHITSIVKSREH